jgi:hypothetical protein
MKTAYACLLGLCVFVSCGFDGCTVAPQAGTTGGGFPVTTQSELVDSDGNPVTSALPVPGMPVTGVWLSDSTGAAGSEKNFTVKTDADGNAFVENGRVYANWSSAIRLDQSGVRGEQRVLLRCSLIRDRVGLPRTSRLGECEFLDTLCAFWCDGVDNNILWRLL